MTLKTFKINMLLRNYGMKQMSVVLRKKVIGKTERMILPRLNSMCNSQVRLLQYETLLTGMHRREV